MVIPFTKNKKGQGFIGFFRGKVVFPDQSSQKKIRKDQEELYEDKNNLLSNNISMGDINIFIDIISYECDLEDKGNFFIAHITGYPVINIQNKQYILLQDQCSCPICKGQEHFNIKSVPLNFDFVYLGGRSPSILIYNKQEYLPVWYSASGNPISSKAPKNALLIEEYTATVHSCWKIKKNQSVKLYRLDKRNKNNHLLFYF